MRLERLERLRPVATPVAVGLALGLAAVAVPAPAASASTIALSPPSLAQVALVTPVPAPANDERASAQIVHSLPATISGTTVGATLERGEPESSCGAATTNSVWYSVRTQSAERIALDLTAAGELDGTVDVYHAVRSQLQSVQCQQTEAHGKASLSFKASKNGLYLIRVAALQSSQQANFTLEVFLPTPAVGPPGAALPPSGIGGQVDRIQNINAAYAFTMHSGVSYLINLANRTKGACVSGALFAPSTSSFEGEPALLRIGCGGYRLFTPGPGQGGLYSFEVTPRSSYRGVQRFHLQVAPAGPAETAPGIALGNYAHAHARLDGRGVSVLRLYRLDVTSHSNLTLKLTAPASADFNLQLRSQDGAVIECRCGGSGSQKLQRQLQPGRYYAVVSVRDATAGNFTIVRESRTITSTSLSFSSNTAAPGQGVGIDVKVAPASSGPVAVEIERLDPVFGWQFYRQVSALVSEGTASVPFVPPAVGEWRAKASYGGSRASSPSAVGFSYLQVS
ncbi:MAG: hypothetical protein WAU42_00035 [Solirubrobacteraceae bacterium]